MAISEGMTTVTVLSPNIPKIGGARATESEEQTKPLPLLIKEQARALEESCEKGSLRDTLIAARWHKWNLYLGISSAVIASVAAFARRDVITLFNQSGIHDADKYASEFVSILALTAAILTSILTFLTPSEKAGAYHHFSNKLRALRDRIRSFTEIDCSRRGKDAVLCEKFERMVREKSEIDSSHPIVPNWAYGAAYKELEKKSAQKQALLKMRETLVS
jgi:hypothetical protein